MEFKDAASAVYERAVELSKDAGHADLVSVADAVAKVTYGPQGGDTNYDYNSTTHSTTHSTTDPREREAGFR